MDNLYKALRYFDGEAGLDNTQVKYFLKKAFISGDLIKKNIIKDLSVKLADPEYNWQDFIKNLNLLNCIDELSQDEIKEYIIDLVCDHILTIEVTND